MTLSSGQKPIFQLTTLQITLAVSLLFHMALLVVVGFFYHKEKPSPQERFQIFYVTAEDTSLEPPEKKPLASADMTREKEETSLVNTRAEKPPELPSYGYPTAMPSAKQEGTTGEPGSGAPPLPGVINQAGEVGPPLPYPTGVPRRPSESSDSGQGGETPGTPLPSGPPQEGTGSGGGAGRNRVSSTSVAGCKLFILPLQPSSLSKEKALSLCEGLTPGEEHHAKKMEIKVALGDQGEPSDITLTRSCGNKKLDEEIENMLPLMRFDTSEAGDGPRYFLTMIVVFSDEKEKKSGGPPPLR